VVLALSEEDEDRPFPIRAHTVEQSRGDRTAPTSSNEIAPPKMGGAAVTASSTVEFGLATSAGKRWWQLGYGIVVMVMVANLQLGWTPFVDPIDQKYHWGRYAIQWAFTIFVFTQTWLVPLHGYLIDRFGPRAMISVAGILVGTAWVLNSYADSLPQLYAAAVIGGLGVGAVYGGAIGNVLKWFPDRRGLASGLTASGYGAGSALTVLPIQSMIHTQGYEAAFFWFGLVQGLVVLLVAQLLRAPEPREVPAPIMSVVPQSRRDYALPQVIASPPFWVMYAMFVLVGVGGLMAQAQLGPMAKDFHIDSVPVSILWLTLPALTFALALDRVMNGLTRPIFGWISDNIGRENAMFLAFLCEALAVYGLLTLAHDPLLFVILSGLVFFAWGEIYALFPAMCADLYGRKFATTNYGLLYTAKGVASIVIPLANLLPAGPGSWKTVFMVAAALDVVAAVLALVALKPLAKRLMASEYPLSTLQPARGRQPSRPTPITDFGKIPQYSSYIAKDPFRHGLQFPAVVRELGSLQQRILDVGTGDGLFPRLLARHGASVIGYDRSAEKIAEAKAHKDARELKVTYLVAVPQTFADRGLFGAATSVMALPYASDLDELRAFFRSTARSLSAGGKFVSIVLNPSFSAFDENLIVRRVRKLDGDLVQMEFLNEASGAVEMNPIMHQYTREEYEAAAVQGGMTFEWKTLFASPEALTQKGEEFWRRCHETQPYALLIAQKR
jgi:MFS transporter, OFA family, oxalate/formate antiporter